MRLNQLLVCTCIFIVGCVDSVSDSETEQGLSDVVAVDSQFPGELTVLWAEAPGAIDSCIFEIGMDDPVACVASPVQIYQITGLTAGTQHCYVIAAVMADGSLVPPGEIGCGIVEGPPAGPSSTAEILGTGQVLVNWTADPNPTTFKYYVLQSANGSAFELVASVLDPSGNPPAPTSYTTPVLTFGVKYCYEIISAYQDGTVSNPGQSSCAFWPL